MTSIGRLNELHGLSAAKVEPLSTDDLVKANAQFGPLDPAVIAYHLKEKAMRKDSDIPLRVRSRFVSPRPNGTDLIVSFLSDGSVQIMSGLEANDFFERRLFNEDGKWTDLPYVEPLEPS